MQCPEQKGSEPWLATGVKNNWKERWSEYEQTIGTVDLPIFQVRVKIKPFSKWGKKKEKTFLPTTSKVSVNSINNLITNGFNPAYGV